MTKTVIRFFTVADFQEEEKWLREQSKKGLKLLKMEIASTMAISSSAVITI